MTMNHSPRVGDLPETFRYALKRRLLGSPMVSEQLHEERLSNPVALGVLSSDAISSSAYGTEEMLIELLPYAGLAAFTLLLPITGVILFILLLVTLSYREVVQVYTRAGGSYVVARDNFGPRVAQIAAAALLIDYVVTVAVQTAAGTVAVVSAIPALGPYSLEITIGVVLVLCYGNLRGIREAGRSFALPAYLFASAVIVMIVVGLIRQYTTGLPVVDPRHLPGAFPVGHGSGLVMGATVLVLLRSFANGGSSLTGVEAISNSVGAFRPPEGRNARRVLVAMACTLGFLVGGVSWLAHLTHATPYVSGYPSVISQEARLVFGHSVLGQALFYVVQAASALILYMGANTAFNGFPFLASFVAEDRFLPRWLTKRGHRLVFSNGIIVLTTLAIALLAFTGAKVNALVPLYAIGVFTGFAMAGFGLVKHHLTYRSGRWRHKLVANLAGGVASALVVGIFAVAKFTEGAWLVVVIFPVLTYALIRLNREYRAEAAVLEGFGPEQIQAPNYARHLVFVLVDALDLATLEAIRYGRSLKPTELRAVHFMVDSAQAELLQARWAERGVDASLQIVDCPDRRLTRAVQEYVARAVATPRTGVTVLLPRRSYSALLGPVLHDRTADKIARAVNRVPNAAATIVPFDVSARLRAARGTPAEAGPLDRFKIALSGRLDQALREKVEPVASAAASPISSLVEQQQACVEGRIRSIQIRPHGDAPVLACRVADATGEIVVLFYGRRKISGVVPGRQIRLRGTISRKDGAPALVNPSYELLPPVRTRRR